MQAVEFRQRHRLHDREAECRPVLQVVLGRLAVEPVKQLPRRVAEPEERVTTFGDEKAMVVGNAQLREGCLGPRAR